MVDFEEIDLMNSDEEAPIPDPEDYEEVTLPNIVDYFGSSKCKCRCHKDKTDLKFYRRKRHCISCGKKVKHPSSSHLFISE